MTNSCKEEQEWTGDLQKRTQWSPFMHILSQMSCFFKRARPEMWCDQGLNVMTTSHQTSRACPESVALETEKPGNTFMLVTVLNPDYFTAIWSCYDYWWETLGYVKFLGSGNLNRSAVTARFNSCNSQRFLLRIRTFGVACILQISFI